jgi:hypothetical protein
MAKLTHADRARLAHQVLRLKENGAGSLDAIRSLVAAVDLNYVPRKNAAQRVGGTGHPLEQIAVRVAQASDPELPGPTDDEQFVEHLFALPLRGIYDEWQARSDANLKAKHPDDFAQVLKAREAAEAARQADDETMAARGDWPSRAGGLRHGATDWQMANALYDKGREAFLAGDLDADANDWRVILVDSADYTVNLATDQFLSSVASIGRTAVSGALASKTVAAGVFDAADVTLTAVTGDPSEALVIYQHTGTDSTARLIGYIDTATGLPVTPNGGDIAIAWDNGSNRIFKL